jgi:hypothetical protein
MAIAHRVTPVGLMTPSGVSWTHSHPLHASDRVWPETNCYLDVWIELLHSLRLDPTPALLPALGVAFEGDQWTFVKVSHPDLWALYGIAVDELLVWRPILAHATEQLSRGNVILVEADSFHLPDTAGVSYQLEHAKSTIAITGYDAAASRMHYLHGVGGYVLEGSNLSGVLDTGIGAASLPPFAELVRLDRVQTRSVNELARVARALAHLHGTRLPTENPVLAFASALQAHAVWLQDGGVDHYHKWAFATLRQCGASFELAATAVHWLATHADEPVADAVPHLMRISTGAKTLQFKLARVPVSGRMPDVGPLLTEMADAWDAAMVILQPRYGA